MSVSTPNPRYVKPNGRSTWRFIVRYPRAWLRMKLLWRWRRLLRRLGLSKPPPSVDSEFLRVPDLREKL